MVEAKDLKSFKCGFESHVGHNRIKYIGHNETPTMKGNVMKEDAKRFFNKLKAQAQENPLMTIFIGTLVVTATAKLMEANTQRTYARAHEKEIDRRVRQASR